MHVETHGAEGVSRLQKLFLTLDKAIQVRRLFSEGHKNFLQATEGSYAALSKYLEEHEELSINVHKDAIFVGRAPAYQPSDDRDSLPHRLFQDGIVQLGFSRGLRREEYEKFLHILELNLESEAEVFDDDRSTLLWEASFDHIRYGLIRERGPDQVGFWEAGAKVEERVEDLFEVICSPTELPRRQEALVRKSLRAGHSQESPFEGDLTPILSISSQEMGELMKKLGPAPQREMLIKFLEILFEAVGERDGLQLKDLRRVVWRILQPLYERGKFEWIVEILQEIVSIARSVDHKEAGELFWIFDQLEDEERLSQLAQFIRSTTPDGQQALYRYLLLLRDRAIPAMMELLVALTKEERTLLRKAIARKCAVHPKAVTGCLEHENNEVVKEALLLMDKLGDERFIEPLGRLIRHEDPRIQKLAITCLSHYDLPRAAHAILPALDNDSRAIRFFAINRLGNYQHTQIVEAVMKKIATRSFLDFPWEEKEKICGLLATIGGRKVIPFFDRLLQKSGQTRRWRRMFQGVDERALDLQRAALRGLERIRREESRLIIEREGQRTDSLGEEARRILNALERGRHGR